MFFKPFRLINFCQKSQCQRKIFIKRYLSDFNNSNSTAEAERILIWDPIEKKKVNIETKIPGFINWYACGPTVYDSAHIGHASSYIRQDVIRRILQKYCPNTNIVQIMGVTNVDDKIIKRSKELGESWDSLSKRYEVEFFKDLKDLNIISPEIKTRVSDFIPQILNFISSLLQTNYAYSTKDGSVYLDTTRLKNYGKLTNIPEENPGAVEDKNSEKRNRRDFALWKGYKNENVFWVTPWGTKGRPGWHIECSVMASHFFGDLLDIHSGGWDLIFPHHENEEAQCCARFEKDKWVRHWIHTGHLNIQGDVKMSKSLGNTITIQNYLKEHSANELRMLCILFKYNKGMEFSSEHLTRSKTQLKRFLDFIEECASILNGSKTVALDLTEFWKKLLSTKILMEKSLKDDFDIPNAIYQLNQFIADFHKDTQNNWNNKSSQIIDFGLILTSKVFVQDFLTLVGFNFEDSLISKTQDSSIVPLILDELLEFRKNVRNFSLAQNENDKEIRKTKIKERQILISECDNIRKKLDNCGIEIKDHSSGSSWSFKTK